MNADRMRKYNRGKNRNTTVMVRARGKFFRCVCGANVFEQLGDSLFQCHGCPRVYEGS